MDWIIQTDQLCKSYKNHMVVDHVSMHIRKGSIYGFVGENGAGKTTIIRLLTGMIFPNSGTMTIFGVSSKSKEIEKVRKRISAVVETPSLALNLTAKQNLQMQCDLLGISQDEIPMALQKVGLFYMFHQQKRVKDYSLGMRQRLGIAMALIGHPEILILDEPMNGLDPSGIIEIRELLVHLSQDEGITCIVSSHILDELAKIATDFGFISHGKLVKEISKEELENSTVHCYEFIFDSNEQAGEILQSMGYSQFEVIGKKLVRIYEEIQLPHVMEEFENHGLIVKSYQRDGNNLERFYVNLMGGRRK